MEVSQQFIDKLRRNLTIELDALDDGAQFEDVPSAFDRAALATVLENGAVQPAQALTRGQKGARTRAKNKRQRQALGSGIPNSEQATAAAGGGE